jgi:hypothetical protein
MQTSFMHPPFGFALFYLRSVAPKDAYKDKVTGRTIEGVTTGQIYWGAVPYVVIQLIMVAVVLLLPSLVLQSITQPAGSEAPAPRAIQGLDGALDRGGRFALPPTPPAIEGAPAPDTRGPGAPTLDMREGPAF